MDEKQLVAKVIAGDQQACTELFKHHQPQVLWLCVKILNNESLAEDVSQLIMTKVFAKISAFKGDSKLGTWIYRIAVNECLMTKRRTKIVNFVSMQTMMEDGEEIPHDLSVIDTYLCGYEDRATIKQALSRLPRGMRTHFILKAIYGYEHKEIAKMLGLTVSASKSRYTKARVTMQAAFKGRGHGYTREHAAER